MRKENLMSATKYLLPAAILIGAAFVIGGASAKKKGGTSKWEPVPDDGQRPESDRMTFDDGCNDLVVRVRSAEYDVRITDMYWQLRQEGIDDAETLAIGILQMDAPQCLWPPGPDSSLRSKAVWEIVYPAVANYWTMEKAGTLDEYTGVFGTDQEFIE
jgi:hypothetical protein